MSELTEPRATRKSGGYQVTLFSRRVNLQRLHDTLVEELTRLGIYWQSGFQPGLIGEEVFAIVEDEHAEAADGAVLTVVGSLFPAVDR